MTALLAVVGPGFGLSGSPRQAAALEAVSFVPETLVRSGRLRPEVSTSEARDLIWAMSGPDPYIQLVFQRGWSPPRYEEWLGDALISMLLQPNATEQAEPAR